MIRSGLLIYVLATVDTHVSYIIMYTFTKS